MLVCNVSLRPPRRAIAADVAEAATALDAPGTGNVVFATQVDDPASVGETIDAYLGEIMLEAASAADVINLSSVFDADLAELLTAADTQDGTATVPTVTWDSATVTSVTLSGGNLVATNTGTTSASQGAHVVSTSGKTTGKYYFEQTITTSNAGINRGVGIGTTASTYTNMGGSATTGVNMYWGSGAIWANGANTGIILTGGVSPGGVVGIAVDLDNRKIWFRVTPSGNWNNSGTANPATNVGGITVPAGTMIPFSTFGGTSGAAGNVLTANFGASTFNGAVPSGFTPGWPV
jgi:hypothetical protein